MSLTPWDMLESEVRIIVAGVLSIRPITAVPGANGPSGVVAGDLSGWMGTAVYENFEETEQFVLGALIGQKPGLRNFAR